MFPYIDLVCRCVKRQIWRLSCANLPNKEGLTVFENHYSKLCSYLNHSDQWKIWNFFLPPSMFLDCFLSSARVRVRVGFCAISVAFGNFYAENSEHPNLACGTKIMLNLANNDNLKIAALILISLKLNFEQSIKCLIMKSFQHLLKMANEWRSHE